MKTEVKERMLLLLKHLGLGQTAFEEKVGISRGLINNIKGNISANTLNKISVKYPEINKNWLLTGEGEIIISSSENIEKNVNYNVLKQNKVRDKQATSPIPFYDVDFSAGDIEFYNDDPIKADYTMDIPDFRGCIAFRTYGESMDKLIKNGDIVFAKKIVDWRVHLEYGQIYGIVCNDDRRYLKYIRKAHNKDETHFLLRSENTEYDDFLLPKESIKSIWLVHGNMNKRT